MDQRARPNPKAVVFDCFGTLVEIVRRRDPYRSLAGDGNDPALRREIMTRNESVESLCARHGKSAAAADLAADLQAELMAMRTFPDVEKVLAGLAAHGTALAVCSNLAAGYGARVRALLPQVDTFVFSYEVGAIKPEPAIYAAVCERLRLAPSDLLFVGDSLRCDVAGPMSFGMDARHLDRGAGTTLLDRLNDRWPELRL